MARGATAAVIIGLLGSGTIGGVAEQGTGQKAVDALAMRDGPLLAPVFEGWYKTPDGKVHLSFGYYNRSTVDSIDLPIGPNNRIEPGGPDRGQPTHFVPRPYTPRGGNRMRGVFTIPVSEGSKEKYVWTLTHKGRTLSVPSNMGRDYEIDVLKEGDQIRAEDGGVPSDNTPPILTFVPDATKGVGHAGVWKTVAASGSDPVTIRFTAVDDGKPTRGEKPVGVTVRWSKYRGKGTVTFDREVVPIEDATHSGTVTARFSEPGEYILRAFASDGSGDTSECCWTNGFVKVQAGGSR